MKTKKKSEGQKTFNIILSILVALFLWAYVLGEVNPTTQETISNVPVQLLNVQSLTARQLAISGDGEYMVDVVIEGKRADIMNITAQDIVAEADLYGWSLGENVIPVTITVPEPLKVIETKAGKIQITIEELVALSKPVSVVLSGKLPADTEEGSVLIKPEGIEVSGAKSAVDAVKEIQVTLNAENLTAEGKTFQSATVPVNSAGIPVENVHLSANYVDVFAKLYQVKEVALAPALSGELADGMGVEVGVPSTVKIKGTKTALANVDSVTTEPVDISGITGNATVTLSVILPEGVELAKGYETITLGVTVQETSTKVFEYTADEILLEGLTKGKSVNTDAANFKVTVSASKDVINALTKDQLKLYIDVSKLNAGDQTVPVQITYDVALHQITVEPKEIAITLVGTE